MTLLKLLKAIFTFDILGLRDLFWEVTDKDTDEDLHLDELNDEVVGWKKRK